MTWSMIPCSPAMAFCSMVGQAIRQTARPSGPSTMERSNFWSFSSNGANHPAVHPQRRAVRGRGDGAADVDDHRCNLIRRAETLQQRRGPHRGEELALDRADVDALL